MEAFVVVLIAFAIAVIFVALALQVGGKMSSLALSFRKTLGLAFLLVAGTWLAWFGVLQLLLLLPSDLRNGGFAVGATLVLILSYPFLKGALKAPFGKAVVVWFFQGIVHAVIFVMLLITLANANGMGKARQKRTVADIRNTGTALMAWIIDQPEPITSPEAPEDGSENSGIVDVTDYPLITYDKLFRLLRPSESFFYMQEIPQEDGWGHPLEYRLNVDDPYGRKVICIRSPGKDGRFDTDHYVVGQFDPVDYAQDIVWADGEFVRSPEPFQRRTSQP